MSVEQIEQSVLRLGAEERRRFLDWLDDHRHELIGAATVENDLLGAIKTEVGTAQEEEIRRRVAEIESGTIEGIPGEQTTARIQRIVAR